jgi:pimeloyl-ACP methyl ester carboxylesterase
MVVHGDADPLMPLAGAQAMASLFPAAQVETFAGSAHTPFLSRPDRFVEALQRFAAA